MTPRTVGDDNIGTTAVRHDGGVKVNHERAMNTNTAPSRRHFLKTAAATVATFNIVPRHVLGGPRYVPPSEKVKRCPVDLAE